MSSEEKRPLADAQAALMRFEHLPGGEGYRDLLDYCSHWLPAGSVRRERPMVGDIEIVALPHDGARHAALLRHLDTLVQQGVLRQALKSDSKPRWGQLYRAISFQPQAVSNESPAGTRALPWTVELFIADERNYGLISVIRTGSWDFSRMIVTRIKQRGVYRVGGGYLRPWFEKRGEEQGRQAGAPAATECVGLTDSQTAKLPIIPCPDEQTVFAAAGLPWIHPKAREIAR